MEASKELRKKRKAEFKMGRHIRLGWPRGLDLTSLVTVL